MKPTVLALLALASFLAMSATSLAADPTVLRIVAVETRDAEAYLREIEKGRAHLKRLGSPGTIRVWRARFAGAQTGTVVVSIEYPSIAALASDDEKGASDAEFQAWLKGLDKVRKVVSDSLYQELGP